MELSESQKDNMSFRYWNNDDGIADLVYDERKAQDRQWGLQDHEYLALKNGVSREDYETEANDWKDINTRRFASGTLAWDGILLEEVYEALGAETHEDRVTELVQVMAVAAAMIDYLARHRTPEPEIEEPPLGQTYTSPSGVVYFHAQDLPAQHYQWWSWQAIDRVTTWFTWAEVKAAK